MELKGRTAWITGGGRGIGRACAEAFSGAGARVAVSARTANELDETVDACGGPTKALGVVCDVTRPSDVTKAYTKVKAKFGAPDILVPAAGMARSEPFHRTSVDMMREHWDLNVMGVFHVMQASLPSMVERGWGRVVAIASVAGKQGAPYISAYASSKHALLGLTRSVASEVAAKGVTVNAVCPGYVNTRLTQGTLDVIVKKTGLSRSDARKRVEATNPQNRMVEPEEVAATVLHLCTAPAQSINGQAITIDGGTLQW